MKRQFGSHIPGEGLMNLRMLQEQLRSVLETLDDREAGVIKMRFGLADGQPKTLDEIGKAYGVTRERIRQIESKTMSKLRHPKRSGLLRDYLDTDYFPFQEDHESSDPVARGLVYCEKHGWSEKPSSPGPICACCPCPVAAPVASRPQEYCSNACKQAAYRRRRVRASTVATILDQTASYFGVSVEDLCSTSRSRVLVTARHIAMYLCREFTDLSPLMIGQQFGGRDHTTVINADRKIRSLMAERRSIYTQVTELTNRIKQQARTG